jgi:hypothetical protein
MRIFHGNKEITKEISRTDSLSYSMTYLSGEYIYIASDFPFNHLYIKMGAIKNATPASMTVEYNASSGWNSIVELRDETLALSQDGYVEFTPNRDNSWPRLYSSQDVPNTSVIVYDKYWTRVSFDANLDSPVEISFIGNKFSDDEDLYLEYPVFDDSVFLTAFKAGKSDWEDQCIRASEVIVADLIRKNVIVSAEQILDRKVFTSACVCKTAEMIFTSFGNDYEEQRKLAKSEYASRMDLSRYKVDNNNNAILDVGDVKNSQGWLSR